MTSAIRIDAHHHLWSLRRGRFGWMERHAGALNMNRITRPCEADEFLPILDSAGFSQSILVQADPIELETDEVMAIAAQHDFIAGVVGWADLEDKNIEQKLCARAAAPLFKGVRVWLLANAEPEWLLDATQAHGLAAIGKLGLTLDALMRPQHLSTFDEALARHPEIKSVLCHAGKPEVARWRAGDGDFRAWERGLKRLAARGCLIKLSGLVTDCGDKWSIATIKPYVESVLEIFGPRRTMWGSDWPVVNRAGGYAKWLDAAESLTKSLNVDQREALFGEAASEFYDLAPWTKSIGV